MTRKPVLKVSSKWEKNITKWAEDRNLIEGSNPLAQMDKLREEVAELHEALLMESPLPDKLVSTIDAIGDIQVVLAVMCAQLNLSIDGCREAAWQEIKYRKGKLVDGVFVKDSE